MNIAQIAVVEAQNRALVRLLLGNAVMAPSLAMFAGEPMDADQQLQLATLAMNTQVDVIYLAFDLDENGDPALVDITVFLPRDGGCHGWSGCSVSLAPDGKRAILVSPSAKGHFQILPGEIVQMQTKPAWAQRGRERAANRLAALMTSDLDVSHQVKSEMHGAPR